jgi:mannitol-specific phosphotransferase system IIBC component
MTPDDEDTNRRAPESPADKANASPARNPRSGDGPTENPLADNFSFDLSVPPITVRMVDASALADYEVWLFAASLTSSASLGFLVAFIQSAEGAKSADAASGVATAVFAALFIAFFVRALVLRHVIRAQFRVYKMSATHTKSI